MIKITDGINTREVTLGMYESLYRNMGYKPVDAIKNEPKKEIKVEQPKIEEPKKEEVKEVRKERPNCKK